MSSTPDKPLSSFARGRKGSTSGYTSGSLCILSGTRCRRLVSTGARVVELLAGNRVGAAD